MSNTMDVTLNMTDVDRKPLNEKFVIYFYNQNVTTLSLKFEEKFKGMPLILKDVPSFPTGLSKVVIVPTNYRSKSMFKNISEDDKKIDEIFFVEPNKAKPKLIDFADIVNKSYGNELRRILDASDINANIWTSLDKRNRATIFNLSAKILNLEKKYNLSIFKGIEKIEPEQLTKKNRARIFARVDGNLFDEIRNSTHVFDTAPGLAHDFYGAWKGFANNSFKSRDKAGNIQFTFASNNDGLFLADIDLDDHSGIQHVFDVIKHSLSGNDTDPYNIHQILSYFQGIKPEYDLI